jgi:hypothetical protein
VACYRAVPHARADRDAAVGKFRNPGCRQTRNVDQRVGLFDVLAHQIEQVRSSAEKFGVRLPGEEMNGSGYAFSACVSEVLHSFIPAANTSRIAAEIPT